MKKAIQAIIGLACAICVCTACSAGQVGNAPETTSEIESGRKEPQNNMDKTPAEMMPTEVSINLERQFDGASGCMVIYDTASFKYYFYNEELCRKRFSPLSTFKIVSAIVGLDEGVIQDADSTMDYGGENYPVEQWNADMTLETAFQNSCIWYFRQIIDKVGSETVEKHLKKLAYGNLDISEWNGNGINLFPELNGFWLCSSLEISPLEQVDMLYHLFESSDYSEEDLRTLKSIMLVSENGDTAIYGKTGSSNTDGMYWFVGFCEKQDERYYFAVFLDNCFNQQGNKAKDIAIAVMN